MADMFSRSFGASGGSVKGLMDFADVPRHVAAHVKNVYQTLCVALIAFTAGIYLCTNLIALSSTLGFIGAIGGMFWLAAQGPGTAQNEQKRTGILCFIAFCKGIGVAPLVTAALYVDPNIVWIAAALTATVFACFSAAALKAEKRSYLYLGGMLGSALSGMFWLGLANLFFHSPMIYNLQIYGGLLVFCGYVCYDTQIMIERARMAGGGKLDPIQDALSLFLDFVAIFVRILIILMKNRGNNDRRRRN